MSSWQPIPQHLDRPVAIIGGGVLGRRLAVMWASRGGTVNLCDSIPAVREQARQYFDETAPSLAKVHKAALSVFRSAPDYIRRTARMAA